MKKNIVCNYEMDMALVMDGVAFKACDFEEEDIKLMIPRRRRHTVAEKKSADAKWRASFTGKKNGRSREDYKMANEMNEGRREYRLYNNGSYDRHGAIKNRRYDEAVNDAMNDRYGYEEAKRDVDHYFHLIKSRESYKNIIIKLTRECEEVRRLQRYFRDCANTTCHDVIFRPSVSVDSYCFEALEDAKEYLEDIEAELEWYLKTGEMF